MENLDKKMKKIKWIKMAFVAILLCVGFAACSSDDEETTSSNSIVGSWKYEWKNNNGSVGYALMTFNNDGKGHYFEFDDGEVDGDEDICYYYNKEQNLLGYCSADEDPSTAQKYATRIIWQDKNTFTWDEDGGSVWKRQ